MSDDDIRCQFCGTATRASEWGHDGQECPICHRLYDAMRAQDEEDD